jgi:ATP-binding cassette subfamily B protein
VAHRLKTVLHYDKIFVLEEGKVVQKGTSRELLETQGPFRDMVGDRLSDFRKLVGLE